MALEALLSAGKLAGGRTVPWLSSKRKSIQFRRQTCRRKTSLRSEEAAHCSAEAAQGQGSNRYGEGVNQSVN
jgi:hypothetical protein